MVVPSPSGTTCKDSTESEVELGISALRSNKVAGIVVVVNEIKVTSKRSISSQRAIQLTVREDPGDSA